MLNMHLTLETPDINLYWHARELMLRENLNLENIRLECSTCNVEPKSSGGGSGSSSSSPQMMVIAPMENSPPVAEPKPR